MKVDIADPFVRAADHAGSFEILRRSNARSLSWRNRDVARHSVVRQSRRLRKINSATGARPHIGVTPFRDAFLARRLARGGSA
jgi:hypothetical protein